MTPRYYIKLLVKKHNTEKILLSVTLISNIDLITSVSLRVIVQT